MPLGKRSVSFKPESSVRVMLLELETVINALRLPLTLDDVINSALRDKLPSILKVLRLKLSEAEQRLVVEALTEAETVLTGTGIPAGEDDEFEPGEFEEEVEEPEEPEADETVPPPDSGGGETVSKNLLEKMGF